MIYAYIAFGILVVVGALVAIARYSGKEEAQNEALQKTDTVQKGQLDIAARPPADADSILERMHSSDL